MFCWVVNEYGVSKAIKGNDLSDLWALLYILEYIWQRNVGQHICSLYYRNFVYSVYWLSTCFWLAHQKWYSCITLFVTE